MPKDDWAKYARRDRGRRAAHGDHFRKGDYAQTFKKRHYKPKAHRSEGRISNKCVRVQYDGYVIVYHGDSPETAKWCEVVIWDWSKPMPAWPGFP